MRRAPPAPRAAARASPHSCSATSAVSSATSAPSLDAEERQNRWFFFGQDTWRVNQKLTINFGVRWELYRPQTVTGAGKGGFIDVDTGEVLIAGSHGVGLDLNQEGTFTTIAPRLGIAYRVTDKTVVRMGYGRGFDIGVFGSVFGHNVTQNLPVLGIQSNQPAQNYLSVFTLAQGPQPLDPATILNNQPKGPNGRPILPNGVTAFILPETLRLPTSDQWNVTIQHQLPGDISVEAAYVGTKGTHVFAGNGGDYDFNQATVQGFGTLTLNQRKPFFNKFGWSQNFRYYGSDASNHGCTCPSEGSVWRCPSRSSMRSTIRLTSPSTRIPWTRRASTVSLAMVLLDSRMISPRSTSSMTCSVSPGTSIRATMASRSTRPTTASTSMRRAMASMSMRAATASRSTRSTIASRSTRSVILSRSTLATTWSRSISSRTAVTSAAISALAALTATAWARRCSASPSAAHPSRLRWCPATARDPRATATAGRARTRSGHPKRPATAPAACNERRCASTARPNMAAASSNGRSIRPPATGGGPANPGPSGTNARSLSCTWDSSSLGAPDLARFSVARAERNGFTHSR